MVGFGPGRNRLGKAYAGVANAPTFATRVPLAPMPPTDATGDPVATFLAMG